FQLGSPEDCRCTAMAITGWLCNWTARESPISRLITLLPRSRIGIVLKRFPMIGKPAVFIGDSTGLLNDSALSSNISASIIIGALTRQNTPPTLFLIDNR